jgi:hypothetical protein
VNAGGDDVLEAGARGAVGAMAMTGMRVMTVALGLVDQTPPQAMVKQRARGLLRRVPRGRRPAAIEALHWGYGAAGGAAFALLPDELRRRPWAGPGYGLALWLGFEVGLCPLLGLRRTKRVPVAERASLAADHLLYGLVLSAFRRHSSD